MFNWYSFEELSLNDLYAMLALRQEVFTVEQKCIDNDLDFRDQSAMHLIAKQDNKIIAYLRLFPQGIVYPDAASFGRVVTAFSHRGKGIGKKLIEMALDYLKQHSPQSPVIISAQSYLKKFYEEHGFRAIGEPYEEAGISHLKMCKDGMKIE